MKPQVPLVVLALIILIFAVGAETAPQKPAWDLTLAANTQTSSTLSVVNQCQKAHSFRVTQEEAPFVLLTGPPEIKVPGRKTEVLPLVFDTSAIRAGRYQGRVIVACVDCKSEPTCTQDRETLLINLVVTEPAPTTVPSTSPTATPPPSPKPMLTPTPTPRPQPTVTPTTPPAVRPAPSPSPQPSPPISTHSPAETNCCKKIREQNGGKVMFQVGDKGVELSGHKLIMRVGNKSVTWTFDFDIEQTFCKLDDFRITSKFSQFLESRTSGGAQIERGSTVSLLMTGPDRENKSSRPNLFFQFQAQYLDPDGKTREYSVTMSLDEQACTWQLQLLKDDTVYESQTHPPRAANVMAADVGTNPAFGPLFPYEYRDWWDTMFSLLTEINTWYGWLQEHPNANDRNWVDEAFSRWRLQMLTAINTTLAKGEGLTQQDRQMLSNMSKLLEQRQLTQEVITQFAQLHNQFREGVRLRN